MQKQPPLPLPPFFKRTDIETLKTLRSEAAGFLRWAEKRDIFIIQVLIGTKKVPAMTSLLFILYKSGGKPMLLVHKSPPKLVRDVSTWLLASKDGIDWQDSVQDRIEDSAVSLSRKMRIPQKELILSFEIGKRAEVEDIVSEAGAFIIKFR
ncbi:MAG: hypothetical protein HZA81_02925 [Candidatus Taylorbacteria bacterium]|nr:hypothetical protein [Candidatus Taylorbacteria bacterium]